MIIDVEHKIVMGLIVTVAVMGGLYMVGRDFIAPSSVVPLGSTSSKANTVYLISSSTH